MAESSEREATFYARVGDASGFSQAVDHEAHEQWQRVIMDASGKPTGLARIRATARGEATVYQETLKVFNGPAGGIHDRTEHTVTIDKSYFEAWRAVFGELGVFKVRYVFLSTNVTLELKGESIVLPEVKFEVDVFVNSQGQRSKWCKVDIELDHLFDYLEDKHPEIEAIQLKVALSSLPIKLEDAFSTAEPDEVYKAAEKKLWDSFAHSLPKETSDG